MSESDQGQTPPSRKELIWAAVIITAILTLLGSVIIGPRLTTTQAERDARDAAEYKQYLEKQAAGEAAEHAKQEAEAAKKYQVHSMPMDALDGVVMTEGGGDMRACKTTVFYDNIAYHQHQYVDCDWGPTKRYHFHNFGE